MQVAGGGGYAGKKTKSRIRELDQRALEESARAGSREQVNGGATSDYVHTMGQMKDLAEKDYSALDFAKQVYTFPGKLYDDADQGVRGLIDLTGGLFRGEVDPGLAAEDLARGTLDSFKNTLLHPVTQANEHPLEFMGNAAAVAGGVGALDSFLAGRMLPEGPQALGAIGKRLESGEVPQYTSAEHLMPTTDFTASLPDMGVIKYPEESGLGVVKSSPWWSKSEAGVFEGQAFNEAVANQLNLATGERLRMPGVQYGEWEYTPRDWEAGLSGMRNMDKPFKVPGSLIEWVDNLKTSEGMESFDWANPDIRQYFRNQDIFDQIIGNDDRTMGANQFLDPQGPLTMDNGVAFPNRFTAQTRYTAPAWEGQGGVLSDAERAYVQELLQQLENPTPGTLLNSVNKPGLRGAIDRARALLESNKPYTPEYRQRGF